MIKLILDQQILVQHIDNECVIVSPNGGMITTINETGAFLIGYLKDQEHCTENDLVDALSKEYDASNEVIVRDVKSFIEEMRTNKIII